MNGQTDIDWAEAARIALVVPGDSQVDDEFWRLLAPHGIPLVSRTTGAEHHQMATVGMAAAHTKSLAESSDLEVAADRLRAVDAVAAAYVEAMLPLDSLEALGAGGLDIVVVSLVAVPSYVCAGSATPLAATLLAKGLSPGAVLAGLLLGPATNVATLGFLRAAYGLRATVAGLVATVAAVWIMALALNLTPLGAHVAAAPAVEHPATLFEIAATAAMAALVLWSLWRGGVRTWLAELGVGHVHAH